MEHRPTSRPFRSSESPASPRYGGETVSERSSRPRPGTQGTPLQTGDILVVTQKVVSKAEGRTVDLATVRSLSSQRIRARRALGPRPQGRRARTEGEPLHRPHRPRQGNPDSRDLSRLRLRERGHRRLQRTGRGHRRPTPGGPGQVRAGHSGRDSRLGRADHRRHNLGHLRQGLARRPRRPRHRSGGHRSVQGLPWHPGHAGHGAEGDQHRGG